MASYQFVLLVLITIIVFVASDTMNNRERVKSTSDSGKHKILDTCRIILSDILFFHNLLLKKTSLTV